MDRGENRHQERRNRHKPSTIHSLAQAGDLTGLRSILLENPALINARNPIMAQTPLHVAASGNQANAVALLLEWNGLEKVDIEATNMYGETALHLAAKNGCTSALKLLLGKNASIEAKAHNGMTPLHLAVWSAVRTEACDTVEALLDHNADVNAEDNEGMTPLSHIPKISSHEKLQTLLKDRLELQLRQKAQKICQLSEQRMADLEAELNKLMGLKELKLQLWKWAKGMILDEKRKSLGLKVPRRRLPHMAFLGSPGTGKTMVARLLAKLLCKVGVLSSEKVVEVQRTDLVGEFVGHTGPKTRRKIEEAVGGILFIDEAYRLVPAQKADDKDYGLEALEEIMSVMDSGKLLCIFAGYAEPMQRVFKSNEGFCRRVTRYFYFQDFSTLEIAQMIHLKMEEQTDDSLLCGLKLDRSCSVEAIAGLLEQKTSKKQRSQLNGGLVWPLLLGAKDSLDFRLDLNCCDCEALVTISLPDIEVALDTIPGELSKFPSY
ncbi:hypothetical protein O6H91_Y251000 [Diphasiastrum complanatum]|nr:hypothetical protein O6H91_Y251000 [Diphasiastrum complanatum]KAJ7294549.1 hypothetical protein O6H91_Y251000 [Diphasiastrum complanatum]